MANMNIAGRRGEVTWKASFLSVNQEVAYDTFWVEFGLIVPFVLGNAYHVWDLPNTNFSGPGKSIPLRPDTAFKRRTLSVYWIGMTVAAASFGLFCLALSLFANLKFGLAGAALAGSIVIGALGFWLSRRPAEEARHRDIRLLLGFHQWGTSDPATWSAELSECVVDPEQAFGVPTFAALAEKERTAKQWGNAMWAARLSTAVEDEAKGQALTDAILAEPDVAERLRRVRKKPDSRDEEFGPSPGLTKWLKVDPEEYIQPIG